MVSTWLWCKSRSRIAVATTGSANTVPHSATLRFEVDQHGASFVAATDQLEEQMRRVGLQRQVAEFVDDQQLWLRQREQFLVQAPLAMRLGEASDQRRRRGELHRVTGQDRLSPERDRQVRLTNAWRAEQQYVLAVGDPT